MQGEKTKIIKKDKNFSNAEENWIWSCLILSKAKSINAENVKVSNPENLKQEKFSYTSNSHLYM